MNKKKLLALLMALVMTLTLVPVTAFADETYWVVKYDNKTGAYYAESTNEQPTGTHYNSEAEAVAAYQAHAQATITYGGQTTYYVSPYPALLDVSNYTGSTRAEDLVFKVFADCNYETYDASFTISVPMTMDLNGHIVAFGQYGKKGYTYRFQKDFILKDTSAGETGVLYGINNTAAILLGTSSAGCTFTLESGTIKSETAIFDTYSDCTINVTGGHMVSYSRYGVGDSRGIVAELSSGCALNISGGEFRSDQSAKSWDTMSFDPMGYPTKNINANSTISVTGGTFSGQAIQKYVPGYTADQSFSNENPAITVGEYTITRYTVSSPYGAAAYDVYLYTVEPAPTVNYVAQIGETPYATLADAIAAVPADGSQTTIQMIADEVIEGNGGVTIPANKNIILDLNGNTISNLVNVNGHSQVILNKGTLKIKDTSGNGEIFNDVQQGTIPGNWWPNEVANYTTNVVTNYGNLTIESGKLRQTANGYICFALDNNTNGNLHTPVATINGGTLISAKTAVRQFCNSTTNANTVVVNDGTIQAGRHALYLQDANNSKNIGSLTVNGGVISGLNALHIEYLTTADFTLNVTGGKFSGSNKDVDLEGTEGDFIAISGGYFTADPTAYVVTGKSAVVSDIEGYDYKVGIAPVAQIGDDATKQFTTLQAAIDAAQDGETVVLLRDISLTNDDVPSGKDRFFEINKGITIDGNGNTITATYPNAYNSKVWYVFEFVDGENNVLNWGLKDLTINSTGLQAAVMVNSDSASTLTASGLTITTDGECLYDNGPARTVMTNCQLNHRGYYRPDRDTGINRTYFSAVMVGYSGQVELHDCAVTTTDNGIATFPTGSTISLYNTTVTVDNSTVAKHVDETSALWAAVTSGYTHELAVSSVIHVYSGSKILGTVRASNTDAVKSAKVIAHEGSIFSDDIGAYASTNTDRCGVFAADGCEVIANTNEATKNAYPYTVGVEAEPVAEVNGTQYATLQAAIDAAQGGDTVKLLTDVQLSQGVDVGKNVTLDLNGKTISNASDMADDYLLGVLHGGTLTVNDSSATGKISMGKKYCAIKITKAGNTATFIAGHPATLIVNAGTIEGPNYAISGNGNDGRGNSVITINGGTIRSTAGTAIYQPNTGDVTLNGGTITGLTGVEVRSGSLNIPKESTAVITGTGTPASISGNGNGTTTDGAGVAIAQHTTHHDIDVAIAGGTISGQYSLAIVNPNNQTLGSINASVTGGKFSGNLEVTETRVSNFISGGIFSTKPAAAYIATGYAAMDNDENSTKVAYPYKVAKMEVTENPAAAVTVTVHKQVDVDSNDVDADVKNDSVLKSRIGTNTSVSGVALTNNLTAGTTESNGVQAVVNAAKINNTNLATALDTATSVEVKVDVTVVPKDYTAEQTFTFSLTPTATVTVTDANNEKTEVSGVKVTNEMIDQTQDIEVTLYTGFEPALLTHRDDDEKVIGSYTKGDTASDSTFTYDSTNKTCTLIIHHFSTIEATAPAGAASVDFEGGSLRRRVLTLDHNTVVRSETDFRMKFAFNLPDEAEIDLTNSYFYWSTSNENPTANDRRIQITSIKEEKTTIVNNVGSTEYNYWAAMIINGVPYSAFDTHINCKMHLVYNLGGKSYAVEITKSKSVKEIANGLTSLTESTVNNPWIAYGHYLLGDPGYDSYFLNSWPQ